MNRGCYSLITSIRPKKWQRKLMIKPNCQKDCVKHEMILKVIMMCASSQIIHKKLEAVMEANRGQIENKRVSSSFE